VPVAEEDAPAGEAPTDDDLAAFVAEGPAAEVPPIDFTTPADVPAEEAESTAPDDWGASAPAEPAVESESEHGAGAFEAGFQAASEEMTREQPAEPELPADAEDELVAESEAIAEQPETVDQVISETVLEEFIVSEIDAFLREQQTAETQPAIEEFEEQSVTFEDPGDVPVAAEIPTEPDGEGAQPGEETAAEPEADVEVHFEETTEESHTADSPVDSITAEQVTAADESAAAPLEPPVDEGAESADAETPADMAADESVVSESPAPVSRAEAESEDLLAGEQQPAESEQPAESPVDEPAPPVGDEGEVLESAEAFEPGMEVEQPDGGEEILAEAEADEPEPPQEAPAMEPERAEAATSDETADSGESEQVQAPPDLMAHLRDEVAFLRQQGQEKDRQIVAWINGAQWLQPFVDQIRALEQQVERLGDLQAQRDAERIADLKTDRDRLRERLSQIESEMAARSATPAPARDRSWFRRMMGSD
jgi:hypothetical protein